MECAFPYASYPWHMRHLAWFDAVCFYTDSKLDSKLRRLPSQVEPMPFLCIRPMHELSEAARQAEATNHFVRKLKKKANTRRPHPLTTQPNRVHSTYQMLSSRLGCRLKPESELPSVPCLVDPRAINMERPGGSVEIKIGLFGIG